MFQINKVFLYSLILLLSVFISSISQIILKKSALIKYDSRIKEYLNKYVIGAYSLFFLSTIITIIAYKVVPLSLGPVIESFSYLFITYFAYKLFNEKINKNKKIALTLIILGIIVYSIF